jgi:hypothetical protein
MSNYKEQAKRLTELLAFVKTYNIVFDEYTLDLAKKIRAWREVNKMINNKIEEK